jgi:hypothetical protein
MRNTVLHTDPAGISPSKNERTIFIWLDILGFADALEKEEDYRLLAKDLKEFQRVFNKSNYYESQIISDGIVLWLKRPTPSNLSTIFKDIGEKQLEFTLKTEKFIRGGISYGSKLGSHESESGNFISNGLARAVKIESRHVTWPVVGTTEKELISIRGLYTGIPASEHFDLLHAFNVNGKDVFFIDFLQESKKILALLNQNIESLSEKPSVRAKYIWLLKYYIKKFGYQETSILIKRAIL